MTQKSKTRNETILPFCETDLRTHSSWRAEYFLAIFVLPLVLVGLFWLVILPKMHQADAEEREIKQFLNQCIAFHSQNRCMEFYNNGRPELGTWKEIK